MRTRTTDYFTVILKPAELPALDRLAKDTGRSKGAVIRRLLTLAGLPEGRRLLGELPTLAGDPVQADQPERRVTT